MKMYDWTTQPKQLLPLNGAPQGQPRALEQSRPGAGFPPRSAAEPERANDRAETRLLSRQIDRNCVLSAAHAIVSLAQGLFQPVDVKPPRVVTFTGVDRFSGCTWICGMVAEALAILGGGRVCIVDANVRYPAVHRMFGLDEEAPLTETMGEPRPIIGKRNHTNLWVVAAGASSPNPMAVLASQDFRTVLTEVTQSFDYVLIDTPALGKYPDALQLRWVSDGAVLVIQAESTRRDLTVQVRQTLSVSQIPILAAVLNRTLSTR